MRAPLRALRAFYFAGFVAFGIYLPYFPRWLEARGIRGLAMGVVAAAFPAAGLFAPTAFGLLADRLGLRGSLLRIASAGALLAFGAVAIASWLADPLGPGALVAAVALFSVSRAGMVTMADVLALESAGAEKTTYGRIRLWGSAGFLLAAVVAGRTLDPHSALAIPAAIAIVLVPALVASTALPARMPAPPRTGSVLAELLASNHTRIFLGASFLWQASHSAYDLCYSLHVRDLGLSGEATGIAWAIGVVAEIALMAVSGRWLERASPGRLLALGHAGAALRWFALSRVRSHAVLFVLQPLHALSFALPFIASLAYLSRRARPGTLATFQGLFSASSAGGAVFGMLVWGPIYQRHGGGVTFGVASGVAVLACFAALTLPKSRSVPTAVEQ